MVVAFRENKGRGVTLQWVKEALEGPHPSKGMWPFLFGGNMQKSIKVEQFVTSLEWDQSEDVEDFFGSLLPKNNFIVFETHGFSSLMWDFALEITIKNGKLFCSSYKDLFKECEKLNDRPFFESLEKLLNSIYIVQRGFKLHPITRSLAGYLGYEFVSLIEPRLSSNQRFKDGSLFLIFPSKQIFIDHNEKKAFFITTEKTDLTNLPQPLYKFNPENFFTKNFCVLTNKKEFIKKVRRLKEYILKGDIFQAVLSIRFMCDLMGDPMWVFKKIKKLNPSPYVFFLNLPESTIVGTSPETLVRCKNSVLEEKPIAGTRPKPSDPEELVKIKKELLSDSKEIAEHVMLVDLSRNDLGRVAEFGSVCVDRFMFIETFSHVIHITSTVKAKLKQGLGILDVLKATFPAGTVTGAPKIRAMEIIAELEDIPRGPYAGAVGWLGLDKETVNFDLAILIRSLWIKNGQAFWQAGAGIVSDSDEEREWEECMNKARVLTEVLKKGSEK